MQWLKSILIGRARNVSDERLFHKISLVAVLAWVGLGADGLSSSCYGPEETFEALGAHAALAPFIALACMATIAIICASYSQIIELFPSGGGGYLVASKLLSPTVGVVSGCALLVDYVLTIAISIASGADALFSLVPPVWLPWKLPFALAGPAALTLLHLGGLLLAYLLVRVSPEDGKTLNAVLFGKLSASWPAGLRKAFVSVAMLSATALLFIAAQAGFLDGPRVLANMALDRWFPTRFAT